jgi:hypothetical protein
VTQEARRRALQASFGALCAYEAVAVTTGLVPTASSLCRRSRLTEAALLTLLLLHLHAVGTSGELPPARRRGGIG